MARRLKDDPAEGVDKREARRTELRQAAYECFIQRGYHLTTVDDICAGAKLSKGSFYWYFDSKQEALLAILDGWAGEVEDSLTRHFRATIDQGDRLASVAEGLNALSRRLKRLMPLWLDLLAQSQREPAVREGLVVFHRRVRKATTVMLGGLVDDLTDPVELEALATLIVGGFMGLMSLELADPEDAGFAPKVATFMQLLGHSAILPPSPSPEGGTTPREEKRP